MTGANFLIAETGSNVIVTNEGNGDLTSTLPRVQIVTAAIDKVVGARAELMRNISQMSLRLRMILTAEQWRELQKRVRQPARDPAIRAPGAGGTGKSPVPAPDGFLGL